MLSVILCSCSGILGYSIVLWSIEDEDSSVMISDGAIVPVYIKSNISHVYVIGVPGTKEKIEVPLWKLTEPESRGKTLRLSERYAEYSHQYAVCVLDGLPVRSDPVNTSRQVYRLRKGEVIRALYEGTGAIPTNGVSSLEGKWLRVLTADGTLGWCFSHNLRLFEMNEDGSAGLGAEEAQVQEADKTLADMLLTKWYPDYYSSMISSGNIDLVYMRSGYGFDTGASSGTVAIRTPLLNLEYPFRGATKIDDRIYKFNDAPVQVTVRSPSSLLVQYTDERGMPRSYSFIALPKETNVDALIEAEILRRKEAYNSLRALGPDFKSSNYGTLSFTGDNAFTWRGFTLLVPTVISRNARTGGTVSMQYFLPAALKKDWDGVITFAFEGMQEEVNFLYKKESTGLRLTVASVSKTMNESTGRQTVSINHASNALVIFFQK